MKDGLREDPRTSINWRTHRSGCANYRERWLVDTDLEAGEPLYQVYCLLDTPPTTADEQHKCLCSNKGCWRLAQPQKRSSRADAQATQPAS